MSGILTAIVFATFYQASALPLSTEARAPVRPALLTATAREERQAGRELVCRMEPVIGSRLPVRRCRPAHLTPQEQAAAADELRRVQIMRELPPPRSNQIAPGPG